jgi:hypothetical protein
VTRRPLPRSLYAETARPAAATPPLDGDRRGYNGRGVAMSTATGPQLARRVIGGRTAEIDMSISTIKQIPFYALWRSAVTARVVYGRIRDWLGC